MPAMQSQILRGGGFESSPVYHLSHLFLTISKAFFESTERRESDVF